MERLGGLVLLWLAMLGPIPARAAPGFVLSSPDIQAGQAIGKTFIYSGCGGQDQSPALSWTNPPVGTRAFALTVFDPDARNGQGWWHWLVTGLPASMRELSRGVSVLPDSAHQWRNDFGNRHYDGPCPPVGEVPHHYRFTLYALDVAELALPDNASRSRVKAALLEHSLGQAVLVARYGR